MNNIPKGYKLVPVDARVEKAFDVIDGKHLPTIKVTLPACHPDDTSAWDRRDAIGLMVKTMLAPPQPIYDETEERELARFSYDADSEFTGGWFDYLYGWLACAQSRAKAGEVGHE